MTPEQIAQFKEACYIHALHALLDKTGGDVVTFPRRQLAEERAAISIDFSEDIIVMKRAAFPEEGLPAPEPVEPTQTDN